MIIWLSVALGIAISVALPLIRAMLPKPPQAMAGRSWRERVSPYVWTGVFSLITAVLIIAATGDFLDSWSKALLAGYMYDSTIQKWTTGNLGPGA